MRVTDTHVYFWKSYLSNFARAPFTCAFPTPEFDDRSITFSTSEQCYMAFKAFAFMDDERLEEILATPDPRSAKALGSQVRGFDQEKWNDISTPVMIWAAFNKFSQNEDLCKKLLDTAPKTLVEASPNDLIWGVGLHETDDLILDETNWKGENRLGKVLMIVRDRLE